MQCVNQLHSHYTLSMVTCIQNREWQNNSHAQCQLDITNAVHIDQFFCHNITPIWFLLSLIRVLFQIMNINNSHTALFPQISAYCSSTCMYKQNKCLQTYHLRQTNNKRHYYVLTTDVHIIMLILPVIYFLLNRAGGQQPVHSDRSFLANTPRPLSGLCVCAGIPVWVKYYDSISASQVDAETTNACCQ